MARCTVERLMRDLGLRGRTAGQGVQAHHHRPTRARTDPPTWSNRQFAADRPNRLWVADLTYVKTHTGWVYVAFVIDVFSRCVVGWQTSTSLRSDLAIDALEMAIHARKDPDLDGLIHHSDRGVQYLSIRYTERLAEAGVVNSVGSKGDSYDNALAESFNGLYKTELIHRRGPVEERRARRVGHPHLRRLVQQPPHPQRDRQDPAGRVRGELLPSDRHIRTGFTDNRVSMKPGPIHP